MASAFMDVSRKDVGRILDDVSALYERFTGRPYGGRSEAEPAVPIPEGVDPVEYVQQEYRWLMSLVATGAMRAPFASPWLWSPPAEVIETAREIQVRLDLPGIDRDDVRLSLQNRQVLVVRGERRFRPANGETDSNYLMMERTYGEFIKQIPLPDRVDVGAIEARLSDGVLTLRLPRQRPAQGLEEQPISIR